MLHLVHQKRFDKDMKILLKGNKDPLKIKAIITLLAQEKVLPPKNRNHKLGGDFEGCWECHIEPDWLLIYRKTVDTLILIRTGSHSNLF